MRALVTGANGFIGSHLCEHLLEQGHPVRAMVRQTSDLRWLAGLPVELARGSLEDSGSLGAAVRGVDWVFHTAASLRPRRREDYFRVNTEGTRMLAEACIEAGVGRFVLFSSVAAAGPAAAADRPARESDEPRPVSRYGEGKLRAERVLGELGNRLASVILRFPAVYGPRDRDGLTLFAAMKRGLAVEIALHLSLVYVKDAVRAALLAAERATRPAALYYVSDGQCYEFGELVRVAGRQLGCRPVSVRLPRWALRVAAAIGERLGRGGSILNRDKVRELEQGCWVCDPAAACAELGFVPAYSLERGLAETIEWYEEHGWLTKTRTV
ncbi:MAG: NAD-dependent epimerase/dehydratase family protein [bacterium]